MARETVNFGVADRSGFPPSSSGLGWGHHAYEPNGASGGSSGIVGGRGRQLSGHGNGGGTSDLPPAGLNGPGHFSGKMLIDGAPLGDCVVKVVNAYHTGWVQIDVLDTDDGAGNDPNQVKVTRTNANGEWSVTGLDQSLQYMLKIFPPSRCHALAEVPPAYLTGETGYIDSGGGNFMSTPASPSGNTYNVFSNGKFLFDMPCHVFPVAGGTLDGSQGYSDLNVEFFTRTGSFSTTIGTQSGCTVSPTGGTGANASVLDDLLTDFPQDVDIYVDAKPGFARGTDGTMCLSFNADDTRVNTGPRLNTGYALSIYGTTAATIKLHRLNGSGTETLVADTGYSSWVLGDTLHLRIKRVGTSIKTWIWKNSESQPGTPTSSSTDGTYTGPALALGTSTGSSGTDRQGEWSNLTVLTGTDIAADGGAGDNPTIETTNPGYSGTGYVVLNAAGEGVRFVQMATQAGAGTYGLTIRYQAILAATLEIVVNGTVVAAAAALTATSTSFATNSWSNYGFQADLLATNNIVQIKCVSGEIHFDYLRIEQKVTAPPPPITNVLAPKGPNTAGYLVSSQSRGQQGGGTAFTISYLMTGITGTLITATAGVVIPLGTPPTSGWRVVTVGHGATGASDDAAPSLDSGNIAGNIGGNIGDIGALLDAGFVVVMADYEGMGGQANWRHPYMVGTSAGRSLIDAARACAGLPGVTINNRLAAWGFSQGGHAALWCGELCATDAYGTEFNCVTVALDPVIPTEYVSSASTYETYYTLLNTYGQWVADNTLPLAQVVDGTAQAAMTGGTDYYGEGSPLGDPTTPALWSAAFRKTDPGYQNGGPVLHCEASGGIGAQFAYVSRAPGFGTQLDHRVIGGGHDSAFTQACQTQALAWINGKIPPP